ncbi:MAG: 50S ribosomal protein L5 [bacterium]|nr:50S ribosomal protein L5 [bacterium]
MARLDEKYRDEIVPAMKEKFGHTNSLAVPKLNKIVISMGIGKYHDDQKIVESVSKDLTTITGQRAVLTRARKSVSNFRLREGYTVGCMVTLRGARMYEFLDRLISVVIPRVRDFRGLKPTSFDPAGNFSMGLGDQLVFPEIRVDRVQHFQGMNITVAVRNSDPEASLEMLRMFGMPFRQN